MREEDLFAFLGLGLPPLEPQLLALQQVGICMATLARSSSDARKTLALLELLLPKTADFGILFPFIIFLLNFL